MADTRLARTLGSAREEAGLSLHALAERMQVSWETARRAERDRDPRLSTLRRHVGALPFLPPGALFGARHAGPPLASDAAWRLHRRFQRHSVRRLVLEVSVHADGARRVRESWEGVHGVGLDLEDPEQRTNLLRAVVAAPRELLRELRALPDDERGEARSFEADGVRHEIEFHVPLRKWGFSWRRSWSQERPPLDHALRRDAVGAGAEACAVDVSASVERLELRVCLGAGSAAPSFAAFASPEMSVPDGGAFAYARDLAQPATSAWDARTGTLSVAVHRPQPHVRHGVAWSLPAALVAPRQVGRAAAPGSILRAARERAGLSSREMARRARVSPATASGAENGLDPSHATLSALLAVLPDLRAAELLAGLGSRRELTLREAWLFQRALAGMSAREASRVVEVNARGDARETITLAGLRKLEAGGDLIVRDAVAGTQAGRVRSLVVRGDSASATDLMRIRWRRQAGTQDEFLLVLPESLVAGGATITRIERKIAAYRVSAAQAGRSIGPAYECVVPAERLVLVVRLPRSVPVADIRPFVRAAVPVTNPRWPDLQREAHPSGLDFEWQEATRTATLRVERPLMGLRYSVAWTPR